ncbi:conjugal transfer protein TraD, partial [Cetobacterium sp.]|uniref:conjugal transfer protein TraD n=2 Tax=Cetobacterium sp. TaxID=2071632 RepID=UPI003EE76690
MKIDELNEKIERNREKLQKMQKGARIKSYENNKEKRRKRARNLIMLGALFEIENLHRENASTLLGFIHENKDLFFKNRDRYFEIGGELLEARKNL